MIPYIISEINLIVDDIVHPVANLFNDDTQWKFYNISLRDLIDIKGLGILQVNVVSILFDHEKMAEFDNIEFRKYNIRCKVTDKVGS